ncbi:MAG TPA: LPS export ABC transporter permease LptF [Burkholderiaceae bacterium]|nr:LPS export ABC transporter permease LptF [Burkholderiaceae bacterium]
MLFHSSVRTELARSFGATMVVLFTIVVTVMLIRTLNLATTGRVNPQEVMLVLGYTVLGRLHIILTMALFIAVVSVLSRMYRDSEMVIWMGAGRGLMGLIHPVLRFAWPVLASMVVLVLVAWPWANRQASELRERFAQRGDLQRVQPGQFQSSAKGDRVFFIDKDSDASSAGRNVFISSKTPQGETTITAQAATVAQEGSQQLLVLRNGQRLDVTLNPKSQKLSEFAEYQVLMDNTTLVGETDEAMKSRSTLELVRQPNPAALGELTWRIGLVISAFNLLLVGLAVAMGNPRAGRSTNIVFALFAFMLYSNLLNVGATWVTQGKVSAWGWTVGLHGITFVLAMAWIVKRHLGISLRATLKRRLPSGSLASPTCKGATP